APRRGAGHPPPVDLSRQKNRRHRRYGRAIHRFGPTSCCHWNRSPGSSALTRSFGHGSQMMLLALGYLGLRVVEDVVEVVAVDAVPKIAAVPEIDGDVDKYWLLSR